MSRLAALAIVATPERILRRHGDPLALLAPYERDKAASFAFAASRDAYIAAHLLVRHAAAALTGAPLQSLVLQQRCADCGGPHGRPVIAGRDDVHVSLSHCDGIVAAVAGPSPVAVDVEEWKKLRMPGLLQARVFSAAEAMALRRLGPAEQVEAAARLWVHKECLIKLGLLTLDQLAGCDLAPLGLCQQPHPGSGHTVQAHGFVFTQWTDAARGISAAAAAQDGVSFVDDAL